MFQLGGRQATSDFMADGTQVSFSPNGAHLAAVEGTVHWARGNSRGARLFIDSKPVASSNGLNREFLSVPQWSFDGSSVAIVVRDQGETQSSVLVRHLAGGETLIPMGGAIGVEPELFWDVDGTLYVIVDGISLTAPARAYWVEMQAERLTPVAPGSIPAMEAATLKQRLAQGLRAKGLLDIGIWIDGTRVSAEENRYVR